LQLFVRKFATFCFFNPQLRGVVPITWKMEGMENQNWYEQPPGQEYPVHQFSM